MELCLGTVQFGMDYGINGKKKPSVSESVQCLEYATQNGVFAIDTAAAYGNAEEIIGLFLRKKTVHREKLFLSTKTLPNILDECEPKDYAKVIRKNLTDSLKNLQTDYVDAYLLHSARYAYDKDIIDALYSVQREGLAVKVGVSVYDPEEAHACFANNKVSIIQAPFSIFDQRIKKYGCLDVAMSKECEIHTRSAFLQGLILMQEDQIPSYLQKARPLVKRLNEISNELAISQVELAIAFVRKENTISKLVLGVRSTQQLKENIQVFSNSKINVLMARIESEFEDIDTDIVLPSLWKK